MILKIQLLFPINKKMLDETKTIIIEYELSLTETSKCKNAFLFNLRVDVIIGNEVDRSLNYWWSKMNWILANDQKEAGNVKEEHWPTNPTARDVFSRDSTHAATRSIWRIMYDFLLRRNVCVLFSLSDLASYASLCRFNSYCNSCNITIHKFVKTEVFQE